MSKQNQDDAESWARFERAVDAAVKSGPKHKREKRSISCADLSLIATRPRILISESPDAIQILSEQ